MTLYLCHSSFFAFFMCFSMVCHYQRIPFFLFQCESSPQRRVLQKCTVPKRIPHLLSEALLLYGLFSTGWSSCQDCGQAWAFYIASFRHTPAVECSPSWAEGWYLLHCGPPFSAGEQLASPWAFLGTARISFSGTCSMSSSPSFSLQSTGLVHIFSLHFFTICLPDFFLLFLRRAITEAQPSSWPMGLARTRDWSAPQSTEIDGVLHSQPWFLFRGYPCSSTTIKTFPLKWNENWHCNTTVIILEYLKL